MRENTTQFLQGLVLMLVLCCTFAIVEGVSSFHEKATIEGYPMVAKD